MGRKYRVIQLFNTGPAGKNSSRQTVESNSELAEAGLEVKTIHPFGWPWNPFARMHNAFRGLDVLRSIHVLVNERRADLICAHLESAIVILLFRRLFFFHVPVLIWEVPWSPGWRYREILSRIAIPRADHCVVFSTNQLQLIRDSFGENVNVSFVPFCIDTEFFRPQPRSTDAAKFVWSCGLDAGRDFGVLLEASKGLDLLFRIKPGTPLRISATEFPNVIEEKGFLPTEEFRERYANASIVVVSTRNTPNASGITSLMESLAMGRPTIITDNPALRDYFPPEGASVIVPIGDSAALRRAILLLTENPSLAETMGQKARIFAEQWLSRRRHYLEMANIFRSVIESLQHKMKE
jgi:glycosyltransferase involved in cell wall biosynthesis